jgi:hypothetical protein
MALDEPHRIPCVEVLEVEGIVRVQGERLHNHSDRDGELCPEALPYVREAEHVLELRVRAIAHRLRRGALRFSGLTWSWGSSKPLCEALADLVDVDDGLVGASRGDLADLFGELSLGVPLRIHEHGDEPIHLLMRFFGVPAAFEHAVECADVSFELAYGRKLFVGPIRHMRPPLDVLLHTILTNGG